MVLGAVWCPVEEVRETSVQLRQMKIAHNLNPEFEVKINDDYGKDRDL